jgi:hypothetical protein
MIDIDEIDRRIEGVEMAMDEKRAELNGLSWEYAELKMEKLKAEAWRDGRVAA